MSFLNDVLSTVQDVTLAQTASAKQEIKENVQTIQCNVKKYIEKLHLRHIPQKFESTLLLKNIDKYETEIQSLISTITNNVRQEIDESTSELKSFNSDLKETLISIRISKALVIISKHFFEISINLNNNKYIEVATAIKQIEELMSNNEIPMQYLDIFEVIDYKYTTVQADFLKHLRTVWSECVTMSECTISGMKTIELAIDMQKPDLIHILIQCFAMHNYRKHIHSLSKFILNDVLTTIIKYNVTIKITQNSDRKELLQLKTDMTCQVPPTYSDVFNQIQQTFVFLDYINILVSDETYFISEVATVIKKDFTELLIKDCLMHAIPQNTVVLESDLEEKLKTLQKSLCTAGFYNEKDLAILDFAKDFDIHFANKACAKILHRAREIMKEDLHDMMDIGSEAENLFDQTIQELPGTSPLYFPKCKISCSIMELKDVILEVWQKCGEASNMLRSRLLCTASNVIRLYQQVVVIYHRDNLKTIPLHTALFHNNCMYLAHWLLTISVQMKAFRITVEESRQMMYWDEIPTLRRLGLKCLADQMKIQKIKILEVLRESDLSCMNQLTKLCTTEEAINKCLHQIEDLISTWYNILPANVFEKSIALLYNIFLEELIQRVCNVEDISATIAEQLVIYFEHVYNNALHCFKKHGEVLSHVKLWQKFKELIAVLKGNLQDIEYRWANGKGPIAVVFRPEELKHLIRALFKNTDRRADMLMRIK